MQRCMCVHLGDVIVFQHGRHLFSRLLALCQPRVPIDHLSRRRVGAQIDMPARHRRRHSSGIVECTARMAAEEDGPAPGIGRIQSQRLIRHEKHRAVQRRFLKTMAARHAPVLCLPDFRRSAERVSPAGAYLLRKRAVDPERTKLLHEHTSDLFENAHCCINF
jgi:hypothetical protein